MHSNKAPFRFAHISDLHFAKPTWGMSQLFSKRWLGNANILLSRKHSFSSDHLSTLLPIFREKKVQAVLITGDLSSTSYEKEFLLAQEFVSHLKHEGFSVFVLPGNHDHYTKQAYKQRLFYNFFDPCYAPLSPYSLKTDGFSLTPFSDYGWLVGLDTAIATSLLSSNGLFSHEMEQRLEKALCSIPDHHIVVLMNHFPIFSTESVRKNLLRREALRDLLERHSKIKLFLHGHTHQHCIADLRASQLPIFINSGATGLKEGGSWNLIELSHQGCVVEGFINKRKEGFSSWESFVKSSFSWSDHGSLV